MRFPTTLFRVDLRRLILALCMLSVLLTLANSFYASYLVQRELLLRSTLESNRVYAAKLAAITNNALGEGRNLLAYSVETLGGRLDDEQRLLAEARRLREQSQHFDSVLFLRADGQVAAMAPSNPELAGRKLDTPYTREVLQAQRPHISQPFKSLTGRWLVSLSYPVFDADDVYQGAAIGSIYLHERNVLFRILGHHYYRDGSYLYVVDRNGVVLYHPDPSRIGQDMAGDIIAKAAAAGSEGDRRGIDANGVDMLAGYAWVNSANWGIVAQRPTAATLSRLDELLWTTMRNAAPWLLLVLLGIGWMANKISLPLWQLASIARDMGKGDPSAQVAGVKSWYFEAAQLKRALAAGLAAVHDTVQGLRRESATDPLTGLVNRRGLAAALQACLREGNRHAVLALDIDHFKQVNDSHGHATGDRLLQHVATLMRESCRASDLPCRIGGEEFVILLTDTSLEDAVRTAQRLHGLLAERPNPTGVPVTVSIGVSHYPDTSADTEYLLAQADAALYDAKRAGRNRTVTAPARPEAAL